VTALLLLEGGADVVAADRDETGLAAVAAAGAEPVVCNATHPAGRARLVDAAGRRATTSSTPQESSGLRRSTTSPRTTGSGLWRSTRRRSSSSVRRSRRACAQATPSSKSPSGGRKTGSTREAAVYGSSKAAGLSVTRGFAHAYAGRGVRVNTVCPCLIETPMNDAVIDGIAPLRGVESDKYAPRGLTRWRPAAWRTRARWPR
jgi:NAD(P)-dependent dehydrogenase (short-subunit alcohol dehydrogenase family)